MAERRMFAKTIIDSDAFLDMPHSTQLLYFHLAMRADDDGFINNPKNIMRMVGCKDDDMSVLITKKFLIPFESGVVVIKHWKIHNYIAKDRYKETKYKKEKALLKLDENNSYTECIQPVYELETQDRLGKDRIGKVSKEQESAVSESCVDGLTDIINFYNDNIGLITPYAVTILESYLEDMPADLIILAMKKSVEANKRTIQYIKGILNNWNKKGIKTVLDAENEDILFKAKNENQQQETETEMIARRTKEMEEIEL